MHQQSCSVRSHVPGPQRTPAQSDRCEARLALVAAHAQIAPRLPGTGHSSCQTRLFAFNVGSDLRVRGSSLAKIARELGVTDFAVTLVGKRMCRSAKIEQALAEALQTTPEQLFPDLCERGQRAHRRPSKFTLRALAASQMLHERKF